MASNKCDLCALKVIFDQNALSKERKIEDFIGNLRDLQKNEIIDKGYNRRIFASIGTDGSDDKSEMCAINSKFFLPDNKNKKCPEFILNMGLSIPDALSLNLSRENLDLASEMKSLTRESLLLTARMESLTKQSVSLATEMKNLTYFIAALTIVLLFLGILQFFPGFQKDIVVDLHLPQEPIMVELKPSKITEATQQDHYSSKKTQISKPPIKIQSVPKDKTPKKIINETHK